MLVKNGWALRGRDDPLGQARGNARKIHELVEASSGVKAWVTPVLCFSKAEVGCYGRIGGVEVTTVGSLNRVIADPDRPRFYQGGWEEYSPQEVKAISGLLEKRLGVSPAARPGLPPEGSTRAKRVLDLFFALPDSTLFLMIMGIVFLISLAFLGQASKVFLGVASLYQLLAGASG